MVARRGAGRPADPNSMRSQIRGLAGKEDFVTLPAEGRTDPAPEWPLELVTTEEFAYWVKLWSKPQALMWEILGIEFAVAHYVRSYFEAVEPKAVSGLKTAVLRMEGDLGLSLLGMKSLGWQIGDPNAEPVAAPSAARQTSSGDWLKSVVIETA